MSVRHALLALLSEGPKYGLQLREEFEAGTGEVWPLNVGQVYTTLQRLERDGLVESEGDGTDEGGEGERDDADDEDASAPEAVTEGAADEQEPGQSQEVGAHHPLEARDRHM